MQTNLIQEWHVLAEDKTLLRALRKSNIDNIVDYQKDQLDTAFSYCRQFRNSIDVGANYGIMSYNMSKKFNKVFAFEIVPDISKCCKLNLSKFKAENVIIYDCGLGDKTDEVYLNFDLRSTFSTHVSLTETGTSKVKIETIDSFNFTDIDFIKIDAEGFEPFIIKGGLKTIIKNKPVILYERKGHEERYGLEKNSVLEILQKYGYEELENIGSKNALIGVK